MTKIHYITAEGLEKLKEELNVLTTVERVAAARAIAEARDKGDLTENSEYDAAKDAQAMLEMKIAKLQYMIANARIVDESRLNTNVVQIMNKVKIQNLKNKSIMEVTLVGESEANLEQRKLAISSPIGKGLLGIIEFEILEIAL